MGKYISNNLVSLILQKINEQAETVSNEFKFIGNAQDMQRYLQATETPQSNGEHPDEMGEMAQKTEYNQEKLECPMYIPVDVLKISSDPKAHIPPIKSYDPATGEYVENVCIGDTILTSPSGHRFLIFENFVGATFVNKMGKREKFYVLISDDDSENNKFIKCKPRGNVYGKPIARDVRHKLDVEVPGETDKEREKREARRDAIYRSMGKRYGIFPVVNETFSDPSVLDHLDKALIPETWAMSLTTEHPTNRMIVKKFGGNTPEIDVDFIAVRDLESVDKAIEDVMNLRAELAMGAEDDNLDMADRRQREREYSKPIPRQHANMIYAGGNWHARQRAHDPDFFEREGGKTPVYELLSKNIQEGKINVVIKSVLVIKGDVREGGEGNGEYVLKATFSSTLNHRIASGEGQEIGDLFPPISVALRKPIPSEKPAGKNSGKMIPVTPDMVNFEDYPEFFINQGRTTSQGTKSGFFKELMKNLAESIKNQVDPDEVLGTMLQLVQEAADRPAVDQPA